MEECYKNKFYDIYSKINNDLLILDETRKQLIRDFLKENKVRIFKAILFFSLGIVFLCCTLALLFNIDSYEYGTNLFFSSLLLLFIVFNLFIIFNVLANNFIIYFRNNLVAKYKKIIKSKVVKELEKVFGNIEYKLDGLIRNTRSIDCLLQNHSSDLYMDKSGLFLVDETFRLEDTFKGVYNNLHYEIIERKSLYGKPRHVFICIDLNKRVKEKTIVESRNDINSGNKYSAITFILGISLIIFGVWLIPMIWFDNLYRYIRLLAIAFGFGFSLIISASINRNKMSIVRTEDLGFDKRFCVYSKDQIEARYLVTPAFMERLKNLQTAFGTKNIKCSFVDDKIMFAISTKKDLFEVGNIFTPLTNSKHINEFYNQITSVFEMIDYFKLDQKTGL